MFVFSGTRLREICETRHRLEEEVGERANRHSLKNAGGVEF